MCKRGDVPMESIIGAIKNETALREEKMK